MRKCSPVGEWKIMPHSFIYKLLCSHNSHVYSYSKLLWKILVDICANMGRYPRSCVQWKKQVQDNMYSIDSIYFFFFSFSATLCQRSDPSCRCNLGCSGNAGSLSHCARLGLKLASQCQSRNSSICFFQKGRLHAFMCMGNF